jgi:hypothetical protein
MIVIRRGTIKSMYADHLTLVLEFGDTAASEGFLETEMQYKWIIGSVDGSR